MDNCKTCPSGSTCTKDKSNCIVENNPLNNIKNVIGVMSGKGGVGKSSISTLISKGLIKKGYSVGILDADITGPSIPRLLGVNKQRAVAVEQGLLPIINKDGIKIMSLNLLTDNENDPVIWRGPMISGVVKQFWTDVVWGELDYLLIDMPPGTGDVALTVMQSIPLNGIVMVSVPQDMVSMIVSKAVNMARQMNIDILGVIENMSYITCEDCGKKIKLFNGDSTNKFLSEMNLNLLGELPMLSSISNLGQENQNDKNLEEAFEPIVNNIIEKSQKIL
ncbi:Mrp/NBP35 family ATP-binding protein [Paraclostridium sordellii]|uniref:Mrp/NBP35 family ATP-binding protein n=1 Tax=Paraclostridium sordellii TaxID=1505 RepID=UPI0022E4D1C9|nr:Mrp/NBP35 family ATP-binding protein [Paeniclostridium sordellii]